MLGLGNRKWDLPMVHRRPCGVVGVGALVAGAVVWLLATPYMGVATAAYFLMLGGVALRQDRHVHVPLMVAAITTDLGLVLALELQRDAVATALQFNLGLLPQLHIGCSLLATLLYIPTVVLGAGRWFGYGGGQWRRAHMSVGIAAFVARTLGFVFMFSMLLKHPKI